MNQKLASQPNQPSKRPPNAGPNIGQIAVPIEIYAILEPDACVSVVSRTIARATTKVHAAIACNARRNINTNVLGAYTHEILTKLNIIRAHNETVLRPILSESGPTKIWNIALVPK